MFPVTENNINIQAFSPLTEIKINRRFAHAAVFDMSYNIVLLVFEASMFLGSNM
jgi:hypothetical protein